MPLSNLPLRVSAEFHAVGRDRAEVIRNAIILANEWYGDLEYQMNIFDVHKSLFDDIYVYDREAKPESEHERLRTAEHVERIAVKMEWHATVSTFAIIPQKEVGQ